MSSAERGGDERKVLHFIHVLNGLPCARDDYIDEPPSIKIINSFAYHAFVMVANSLLVYVCAFV